MSSSPSALNATASPAGAVAGAVAAVLVAAASTAPPQPQDPSSTTASVRSKSKKKSRKRSRLPLNATTATSTTSATAAGAEAAALPTTLTEEEAELAQVTAEWNAMFLELFLYKSSHGDTLVPEDKEEYKALYEWSEKQRTQHRSFIAVKTSSLTDKRVEALKQLGFVWYPIRHLHAGDADWNKRFQELRAFKEMHGHTKAAQSTVLGKFVKMQRESKQNTEKHAAFLESGQLPIQNPRSRLSQERIDKLDSIGFQWRILEHTFTWEDRYQQLVEFQKEHGHANVPYTYPIDQRFSRWTYKQRSEKSQKIRGLKHKLSDEREALMDAIGFQWVLSSANKKGATSPSKPKKRARPTQQEDSEEEQHQEAEYFAQAGML